MFTPLFTQFVLASFSSMAACNGTLHLGVACNSPACVTGNELGVTVICIVSQSKAGLADPFIKIQALDSSLLPAICMQTMPVA